MSELAIEPPEPDPASLGAALMMADLHEAVADAAAQMAVLSGAMAAFRPVAPAPAGTPAPTSVARPAAEGLDAAPAAAVPPAVIGAWPEQLSIAALPGPWPASPDGRESPAGWVPDSSAPEAASLAASAAPVAWPDSPAGQPAIDRLASDQRPVAPPAVSSAPATVPLPTAPEPPPLTGPAPAASAAPPPVFVPAAVPPAAVASAPGAMAPLPTSAQSPAAPPVWSVPAASWAGTDEPDQSAAPVLSGGSAGGQMGPAAMASAVPPPRETGGPTGGDVFLDGVRVGRWMAETLAREAGGPAIGATGFDPRLGPTWAGSLQGNGT